MAIETGTKLGRYENRSQLGAGGMGEVSQACDPNINRDVAAKVLPSSFSSNADRLRRFEQEVQAPASLCDGLICGVITRTQCGQSTALQENQEKLARLALRG